MLWVVKKFLMNDSLFFIPHGLNRRQLRPVTSEVRPGFLFFLFFLFSLFFLFFLFFLLPFLPRRPVLACLSALSPKAGARASERVFVVCFSPRPQTPYLQ